MAEPPLEAICHSSRTREGRSVAIEILLEKDEDLRGLQQKGLEVTLAGHMRQLASIKQLEFYWIGLYSALTVPAVGYLIDCTGAGQLNKESPLFICATYFLLTCWFQWILYEQRQSYYGVLRSLRRTQNLFGLHKLIFLSRRFYDSPFPKGYGDEKKTDGTQPWASFFYRLVYLAVLFVALVYAAACRNDDCVWGWVPVAVIAEAIVIAIIFAWDARKMRGAVESERDLAGAVESDYPPRP